MSSVEDSDGRHTLPASLDDRTALCGLQYEMPPTVETFYRTFARPQLRYVYVFTSAVTGLVRRVGQAAVVTGRPPQRMPFSLRMRARSLRSAARTPGWRALALRQRR
ncbi:hypothetical protein RKD20_009250 [Streptomyces sp. SLBN-8D4]|jgi:hypothetical protein